jgi:hypothetical protein
MRDYWPGIAVIAIFCGVVVLLVYVAAQSVPRPERIPAQADPGDPFAVRYLRGTESLQAAMNEYIRQGYQIQDVLADRSMGTFTLIAVKPEAGPVKADLLTEELPRPEGK